MNKKMLEELEEYLEMIGSDIQFAKRGFKTLPLEKVLQNHYDDLKEIVDKYRKGV